MSLKKTSSSAPQAPTKLAVLTAVVLLAHGGLLYGTPLVMAAHSPDSSASFSTRLLTLQLPAEPSQLPPQPAALQHAETKPQSPARRDTPAQPAGRAPQALAAAPTTLRDDIDPGPAPSVAADAPSFLGITPQATPQLLGAAGPPAYLSTAAVTALVAGQEDMKLAQAAIPATPSPTPARAAATKAVQSYAFPPSVHLKYTIKGDVKGLPLSLKGDLQWKQDGTAYDARLEISHFLLGTRIQNSRGELGAQGLEPTRFSDKVRSERAAHFERSKGKITFSANTPDGALLPGTQDHLSVFFQLAAMLGGSPASFPEGTTLPFEAVGPTSIESWVFKVGAPEKLVLPAGPVTAIKLARDAVGAYGTRGEVWLAPTMDYFPVRIRLTESNGDVMDLRWSETVAP